MAKVGGRAGARSVLPGHVKLDLCLYSKVGMPSRNWACMLGTQFENLSHRKFCIDYVLSCIFFCSTILKLDGDYDHIIRIIIIVGNDNSASVH